MNSSSFIDEMYHYLTRPDHYSAALDLTENLLLVEKQLRDEFWQMVTDKLKTMTEDYQHTISINIQFITHEEDKGCDWFWINSSEWKWYFISTDKEDIGLNIKKGRLEELKCRENDIKDIVTGFQEPYRKLEWLCWKTFSSYRFHEKKEKMQILPEVRGKKVNECASDMFFYIKKMIELGDIINRQLGNH